MKKVRLGGYFGDLSEENSSTATSPEAVLSSDEEAMIVKTAEWFIKFPEKGAKLLESCKDNDKLSFLHNRNSAGGKRFQEELARLKAEKDVREVFSEPALTVAVPDAASTGAEKAKLVAAQIAQTLASASVSSIQPAVGDSLDSVRPRKRRWEDKVAESSVELVSIPSLAERTIVNDERLRQQKELQLLEQRIREAAKQQHAIQRQTVDPDVLHSERLSEYKQLAEKYDEKGPRDTIEDAEETGGCIEGGTWEHRARAREMLATADTSLILTEQSRGKHHLSDFLPKEELDRFLLTSRAAASGTQLPALANYSNNQIGSSNVGFQMLASAGWKEGTGLGASSNGMLEPVNLAGQAVENAGIGVTASHEVSADDDEFDQYRKRMMLAYRFRPNPLNNPRRNYY